MMIPRASMSSATVMKMNTSAARRRGPAGFVMMLGAGAGSASSISRATSPSRGALLYDLVNGVGNQPVRFGHRHELRVSWELRQEESRVRRSHEPPDSPEEPRHGLLDRPSCFVFLASILVAIVENDVDDGLVQE